MPREGGQPPQPRSRVSALDRALQVLDQLQATATPMTAYDIARSAGAPLSTMYSIIDDMVEKGLLMRADDRRVWLGPRLYGYGLLYASSLDVLAVAGEEMQRLSREVEETVQICGRDEGMMVVLLMAEGPGHFRVTSRVGSRVPVNWTASGRLLAGHLSPAKRTALFARHARPSPTGRAETDARKLSQASGAALAKRLSVQVGESDASVACLAAPVVNARGECLITISIVLPEAKALHPERYLRAVQAAAERIEQRLGWRAVAEPRGGLMDRYQRLLARGLTLPPAPRPVASYRTHVCEGGLIYLSGQGPVTAEGRFCTGKVGLDVSIEEAYGHAQLVGMNLLAVLHEVLGDLARVKRIVKLLGMVNAAPDFDEHPLVINGCSDLFIDVFGFEDGSHARSAVGMGSLPGNITVEIEAIVAAHD